MCNECCKEFRGWCKAFTITEILLGILEAILLVLCFVFLIFLIMHLIVCASWTSKADISPVSADSQPANSTKAVELTTMPAPIYTTLDPKVECTWQPSKKTEAVFRYYENETTARFALNDKVESEHEKELQSENLQIKPTTKSIPEFTSSGMWQGSSELIGMDSLAYDDQSDGEEADEVYKSSILALVKLRPPNDVTFGCVVTAVSEHWTLTAASCVAAVEEVDSLDNFLIMERYGEARRGRTHTVSDVQLHPLYGGSNSSYDVAALRSETPLRATPLALPTLLDYFLITVGERFTILGFGSFRTLDAAGATRPVRAVDVYSVPGRECRAGAKGQGEEEEEGGWSPRHLSRGREDDHGAGGCGAAAICAAVRYSRGAACTYCAGTPLVRARSLLGIMADTRACAVSCEPALYVNLATIRDWLDLVLDL